MDTFLSMNYAERLTTVWLGTQVLLVIYIICAFVAAGQVVMDCHIEGGKTTYYVNHNWAFLLVWHVLLAGAFSFAGTYIMKKKRTPLAVGAIIGIAVTLANWTFAIAVLQGSMVRQKAFLKKEPCKLDLNASADSAVIFFAVCLTAAYSGFAYLMYMAREELFGDGKCLKLMLRSILVFIVF